jgi:hypothetical protein
MVLGVAALNNNNPPVHIHSYKMILRRSRCFFFHHRGRPSFWSEGAQTQKSSSSRLVARQLFAADSDDDVSESVTTLFSIKLYNGKGGSNSSSDDPVA